MLRDFVGRAPGIGQKSNNRMWFIRANTLSDLDFTKAIWLYGAAGRTADTEVSYNLVNTPKALDICQSEYDRCGKAYIFRNTFVGTVRFANVTPNTGPFHLYNNVFVSDTGGSTIIYDKRVKDRSRILLKDNLNVKRSALDEKFLLRDEKARAKYGHYLPAREAP